MTEETRKKISETNKEKFFLRPCVIILSGVPLSGKTALAEKLVDLSNLQIIDVDVIRNEIDESRKENKQIKMLEPKKERAVMIKSYTEMCQQAESIVNKGIPVVIIGTFSRSEFKQPLKLLANSLKEKNIPLKVFLLNAPDEEVLKRIEGRKEAGSLSNIDSLEKYRWAKGIFEKIEFTPIIEIDTSETDYLEKTLEDLKDLKVNKN